MLMEIKLGGQFLVYIAKCEIDLLGIFKLIWWECSHKLSFTCSFYEKNEHSIKPAL